MVPHYRFLIPHYRFLIRFSPEVFENATSRIKLDLNPLKGFFPKFMSMALKAVAQKYFCLSAICFYDCARSILTFKEAV